MPSHESAALLRSPTTLESLSPELLSLVASHLNTITDANNLSATSTCLEGAMDQDGWRAFFRSRFPSIRVPAQLRETLGWRGLANRMAAMDRAWERRSFDIYSYGEHPIPPVHGQHYRRHGAKRSIGHATPVDASLVPGTADEVVACGAGEDLMVKRSRIEGKRPGRWIQQLGRDHGFEPGQGDITAVSVVHRYDEPEIITGRADGRCQLQRLIGSCVETMLQLLLLPVKPCNQGRPSHFDQYATLDDTAISFLTWEPTANLLATGQDNHLRMYSLSELPAEGDLELEPIEVYDAAWNQEPCPKRTVMTATKFLDSATVACGLANAHKPLRWGRLTPNGLRLQPVAPRDTQRGIGSEPQSVNAIETVGASGKLILSAWCDGTIRLSDLRTPEPFDCRYRSGSGPPDPSSALLTHGQERFVAGSGTSPALHFFDHRSPGKVYHCTDERPCSADAPGRGHDHDSERRRRWQKKKRWGQQRSPDSPPPTPDASAAKCRPSADVTCRWHAGARRAAADATVLRAHSAVFEHVVALARSCDVSDALYCGLRGGLLEMGLRGHWTGDAENSSSSSSNQDDDDDDNVESPAELSRYWPRSDGGKNKAWSRKQRPKAMVTMEERMTAGGLHAVSEEPPLLVVVPDRREDYFYAPQEPQSPWRDVRVRRLPASPPRRLSMDARPRFVDRGPVTATAWWPKQGEEEEEEHMARLERLERAWLPKPGAMTRLPLGPWESDSGGETEEEKEAMLW